MPITPGDRARNHRRGDLEQNATSLPDDLEPGEARPLVIERLADRAGEPGVSAATRDLLLDVAAMLGKIGQRRTLPRGPRDPG